MVWITSTFPGGSGEQFIGPETTFWDAADVTLLPVEYGPSGPQRPIPENFSVDFRLADAWLSGKKKALAGAQAAAHPLLRRELADLRRRGQLTPARARMAVKALVQALLTRDALRSMGAVDVVYTYWLKSTTVGAQLAGVAPVVSRAHGTDLYEHARPQAYHPFARRVLPELEAIYSISEMGVDYLQSQYGIPADVTRLARLGVTVPAGLGPLPEPPAAGLHLLTVSSLTPLKRPLLAVEAIGEAAARRPDLEISWTHIGDGPLRPEVERAAHALLEPRGVRWNLVGQLAHDELLDRLRTEPFTMMLNTSSSEGVPVSIMEAALQGIPSLATDVGATREVVEGSGWLIDADASPADIAEQLLQVADEATAPERRQAASTLVRERFDARRNHHDFVADVLGSIG